MELRPYQTQAVDSIFEAWQSSRSTLAVMPTGTGKTIVLATVIGRRPPGRAMLLAHREELIWQGAGKIEAVTGVCPDIEMAEMRATTDLFTRSDVVVSSVQTQNAGSGDGRMTRFAPEDFSLLIVDEAHHYVAPTFRRVIDYYRQNPNLRVLGVTATPDRADEAALGQIFETVAYNYELPAAIRDGWLVPIRQRMVVVDGLDFSSVRTTAGDLNGADLERAMMFEQDLHSFVWPTLELAGDRKTLVFAVSIAHAERLAEIINRHKPGKAEFVSGMTHKDKRRELFADYAKGKFQFLVNVDVATEGFDDPGIEVVVVCRPTKSRAKYAQMIGRGTRPLAGVVDFEPAEDGLSGGPEEQRRFAIRSSAKPCLDVLDFVGNSDRHQLVSTADILGGDYDEQIVEAAKRQAATSGAPVDMTQAMLDAQAEADQARAAEAARRAKLTAAARYSTREVNPFDTFNLTPARERGWDAGRQPSEKMLALLQRAGIKTEGMTFATARQLIDEITRRWDSKECSFKQARLLKRYGYPVNVSFSEARQMIDALAANGWRRPDAAPVRVY